MIASLLAVTGMSCAAALGPGRVLGQSSAPAQVVYRLARGTQPARLALAPDGSVWIVGDYGPLTRLSPGGATRSFGGRWSGQVDVTRGPDGAIYAMNVDDVVRIDARERMRRYRVRGAPRAMTAGADAVWVAGWDDPPRIERLSPDGAIHEFVDHAPRRWVDFEGIATAADGSVWFTQGFDHHGPVRRGGIGRMRPDGSFSNWRLALADGVPGRIAAGSDGAMWFVEPRAIGRIADNGSITRPALPDGLRPNDIAPGSDGALWFTSDICLGRMTTSGQVTTWPVPGARWLRGLAPASDGTVWLADGGADAIRHVNPAAAAPARCGPSELTGRRGETTATVAYTLTWGVPSDLSIRIARHGRTRFSEDVPGGPGGWPAQADEDSLTVRDLDGDGEPEVMLLLNSGGPHCCAWSRVYRYARARDTYVPVEHRWGEDSVRPRVKDLDRDGRPEFASQDDRFFAVFGSMSPMPLQIWSYRDGRFSDVTGRFPRLIRRDAAGIWRLYRRFTEAARLILPAWVADECRLGRAGFARRVLERERLRGVLDRRPGVSGPRDPRAYVRAVRRLLRRSGYRC